MKKASVYIDGFNLYYGIKAEGWHRYYWLDIEKLANSFVKPGTELKQVKYFTTLIRNNQEAMERQKTFINALEARCPKLEIHYGHFLARKRKCYKCGNENEFYEEKKTDVNLACHLLMDTFSQRYDFVYIVSGDSDLVPVVKMMKKLLSCPKIIVAHPPKRKSDELCKSADGSFSISPNRLRLSQLPEIVESRAGTRLRRPGKWS